MFENCAGLSAVHFSSGDTIKLGAKAFYNCSSLAEITGASLVTVYGNSALAKCTKVNNIELECDITPITSSLFSDTSFKKIRFTAKDAVLMSIPSVATDAETFVDFTGCTTQGNYTRKPAWKIIAPNATYRFNGKMINDSQNVDLLYGQRTNVYRLILDDLSSDGYYYAILGVNGVSNQVVINQLELNYDSQCKYLGGIFSEYTLSNANIGTCTITGGKSGSKLLISTRAVETLKVPKTVSSFVFKYVGGETSTDVPDLIIDRPNGYFSSALSGYRRTITYTG